MEGSPFRRAILSITTRSETSLRRIHDDDAGELAPKRRPSQSRNGTGSALARNPSDGRGNLQPRRESFIAPAGTRFCTLFGRRYNVNSRFYEFEDDRSMNLGNHGNVFLGGKNGSLAARMDDLRVFRFILLLGDFCVMVVLQFSLYTK